MPPFSNDQRALDLLVQYLLHTSRHSRRRFANSHHLQRWLEKTIACRLRCHAVTTNSINGMPPQTKQTISFICYIIQYFIRFI